MSITPVILCGGIGSRLWPISRKSKPKQFQAIIDDESLFIKTLKRFDLSSANKPLILTGPDYKFIVSQQIKTAGVDCEQIILEPSPKNTAPAILTAAHYAVDQDPDAMLLIMPSDHFIPDLESFAEVVKTGTSYAEKGHFVTFGIKPHRPETGYGYIQVDPVQDDDGGHYVQSFTEKPDLAIAEQMLEDGVYLWNAGIFLFKASAIIKAGEVICPDLTAGTRQSLADATVDENFLELGQEAWSSIEEISFDYAIMEKADQRICVPYLDKWTDLGDWNAIWAEAPKDTDDNLLHGNAQSIESKNSVLWSASNDIPVVGVNLDNIVAVAMKDAVLVAHKDHIQNVKDAVKCLSDLGYDQADQHNRVDPPWGSFEILHQSAAFQIKKLFVMPGGKLSLQSHQFRSETWVVIEGKATVQIEDEIFDLSKDQFIHIEQGQKHRLSNTTDSDLVVVEVQTGSYFGEDDIIRYDDIYNR
ncbi:MAG: mannose-1-phosphate guanylyltransferase/mannose-6-phosphate isomerase [Alphaproteobacteria bacterium]|nr:mannose-1-phosphate guanylyltransferase/mannose-6-phosphate isomerase [Alphaproteobacteria bacterium]